MTKPINLEGIENTTKLKWNDWLKFFDQIEARDLSHKEIADKAYEKLKNMDLDINNDWWSQSIAVAYEQHIGRRKPGQRSDGSYELTVSKTIGGSIDNAFTMWQKAVEDMIDFNSVAINSQPNVTTSSKRWHWAVNLADGSRVNFDTDDYSGKTRVTITHAKLPDSQAQEVWREFWKDFIKEF